MNKEIDDMIRLMIGVREWAIQEAGRIQRYTKDNTPKGTIELAKKLEEYVMEGIN